MITRRMMALGRLPIGTMNNTEQAYADYLEFLKIGGSVLWWKFEGIKLKLATSTFYTPDFNVMMHSCRLEMHEVKGFWHDDARVKIKCAAEIYPFVFKAVQARPKRDGGGWKEEVF